MTNDPRFIPGIYNYCDRWCERCAFTSRCLTYAMGKENFGDIEARDLNNKAFWEKFQLIFQQTIEMIKELAMERGIDLNALDMESTAEDYSQMQDNAKDHDLSLSALYYSKIVDSWFEKEYPLFEQRQNKLNTMLRLNIGGDKPYAEADEISDSEEVILWYQHQIYVKLMRAFRGKELVDIEEEDNTFQKDSDGSALVALIAIDRSIGAWGRLQEYFPEKTNSILDILLHLDRLRRKIEQLFPDARNFKRPGFDDSN
jgi:hypothetical protein